MPSPVRRTPSPTALVSALLASALTSGCPRTPVPQSPRLPVCSDLDRQLVRELGRLIGIESERGDTRLQMIPGGLSLDPREYADARSLANPNGRRTAAQALAKLVDRVPSGDSGVFIGGDASLSDRYGLVVNNATATAPDGAGDQVRRTIATARALYALSNETSFEPGCESCPGWRITPATPSNWAEDDGPDVLFRVRLTSKEIGEREHCTPPQSFDFKARLYVVHVARPWMDSTLFSLSGWSLGSELKDEVVSSGVQQDGRVTGLLPMYPIAFVVARDISVSVGSAAPGSTEAQIGSLLFRGTNDRATGSLNVAGLHVIAFINRVVPRSPRPEPVVH